MFLDFNTNNSRRNDSDDDENRGRNHCRLNGEEVGEVR